MYVFSGVTTVHDMLCDQLHNIFFCFLFGNSSCSSSLCNAFVTDKAGRAQRNTGCSCPVRSRYVEAGIVFK